MTEILKVEGLIVEAKQADDTYMRIVNQVDFTVNKGEVVALIGESGSGKTTIALSALGYTKPGCRFAGGRVVLDGEDVISMDPVRRREIRGTKIAYLAQSAAATFNPALSIGKQVTESAVLHGVLTQEQANERAEELYRALDLPDPERLGRRYPHEVSGGQLQRLMAAMALCGRPPLLVLDEPTTALDVTTQIEVLKAFKAIIKEEGSAAIYVTHDLAVVAQIADKILVLFGGEVQEINTAKNIINTPGHDYTRQLMAAVRPTPTAGMGGLRDGSDSQVPVLEVKNLTAGYGRIRNGRPQNTVLYDVNISIGRKTAVGVIGESGCGKSTLARVMAGLLPASQGEVLLRGQPLPKRVEDRSLEDIRCLQIVFQMADTALNPNQLIGEILGRPLEFYRGIKGKKNNDEVIELLHLVDLPVGFADRFPWELSGGQKQRVNLARALAANPDVVLCDEVSSALDTIVGAAIIDLLKRLREELDVSYVFISHDLSTVAAFADEIVVLYAGRVVESGPTDGVLSPPFHPYTKLLISSVPEMRLDWLEEAMQSREAIAGIARDVKMTDKGCPFFERCPLAIKGLCDQELPPVRGVSTGVSIACHREIDELH